MENTLEIIEKVANLQKDEVITILNNTLLEVKKLEKKLKLVEELSLEYGEKADITEIESSELLKEIKYRPDIRKLCVEELEEIDMDFIIENLDFCEEYLIIPIN